MTKITNKTILTNMMTDIPNLIKQPAECCIYCGKSYKKKTSLERHVVLCDLLYNSKNYTPDEEITDIPSNVTLYKMLLGLGSEFNKFKEDMSEIKKYVIKTKKRVNALEWLNGNLKPDIKFSNIVEKIQIEDADVDYIFKNSFDDTMKQIFSRSLYNFPESESPIIAFIQKTNVFYVYEDEWIEMTRELFYIFLSKVSNKLYRKFIEFKKANYDEIRNDETLSLACDKVSVKIMGVDLTKDIILNKIKGYMYSRMKKDIRGLVEYEFDF